MAGTTDSAKVSYHGTTSATPSEVDVITLDGSGRDRILNRHTSGVLWATVSGKNGTRVAGNTADPVAAAKETFVIPAGGVIEVGGFGPEWPNTVVRLASGTASVTYSVQAA